MKTNPIETKVLKPMYLKESIAWFGGFAILLIISTYVLMPHLSKEHFTEFERFSIGTTVPLILMFITAIGVYWFQTVIP